MSDTRFASLKTDPRFRRPKKHHSKVVLDERFKDLLGDDAKSKKKKSKKQTPVRVDKYGRTVSDTQEKDDLRRFYKLGADSSAEDQAVPTVIDYARGAVLMESSDEDEEDEGLPLHRPTVDESDDGSDQGDFVSLGIEPKQPAEDEEDIAIDLDENTIATLDAQVAEYAKDVPERGGAAEVEQTRRLAVVNLDWDHVRAVHLYKIFSSLLSPIAPLAITSTSRADKSPASTGKGGVNIARGRVLSVRVYPSDFGKKRMAWEEKEGPPTQLFKKKKKTAEDEEINEKTIIETGNEADYDEDALRKYQLERLRYYYAIVECDTVDAAIHVYDELEGTELERSANMFDLSFVPDQMMFDDEPRDEATQSSNVPYRAVEFTTDALRHSKVKLTWDEDDPERNHVLRRPLTKKEVEEADFRAYIASASSSEEGSEDEGGDGADSKKTEGHKSKKENKSSKRVEKDKLRMLLLGGSDDELPEGWNNAFDNKEGKGRKSNSRDGKDNDVDMEVTFMPALSETKNPDDENTLERYQRKTREKRKKKKDELRKKDEVSSDDAPTRKTAQSNLDDEFFGVESDSEHGAEAEAAAFNQSTKEPTKEPMKADKFAESSQAELALLATSDNPHGRPAHFDMKAVLKAEKQSKKKKSKRKLKKRGVEDDVDDGPAETQEDFVIDVKDDRFAAIHEDHQFAIDPTHPQFKKTKSMTALLGERSKRQKSAALSDYPVKSRTSVQQNTRSLQSLVESVKRKSTDLDQSGLGKRRKLGKS